MNPPRTNDIQNYYFTFGYAHRHNRRYVVLKGTQESTRRDMFKLYGEKWAFQYPEEEFLPQIERFGLTELLPLGDG